jgi:hypothetical protein
MLPLTRPRRQFFATLVLVALTVVPTGFVVATAWKVNRHDYARKVEADLANRLGLFVQLDRVSYPRPGAALYRGVVLRQEESGRKDSRHAEVARAESLEVRRDGGELTLHVDGLLLSGPSPKGSLAQVVALLQRIGGSSEFRRINLTARTCGIDFGSGALNYSLRDLAGTLEVDASRSRITAGYRIVRDDENAPRCELTLTRDRKGDPSRTTLTFKTAEGEAVPASVLDPFFLASENLGETAKVDGQLVLEQVGAGEWEASFKGNLLDVELASVVNRLAPEHRLAGRARVAVESARWGDRPGRGMGWIEAKGDLLAGKGTIGVTLLEALRTQMHFKIADRAKSRRDAVDFDRLGLSFAIDPSAEIRIGGGLGDEYLGDAIVVQGPRSTPLVRAPDGAANVHGLARALGTEALSRPDLLTPGTAESQFLQHSLPAPIQRLAGAGVLNAN